MALGVTVGLAMFLPANTSVEETSVEAGLLGVRGKRALRLALVFLLGAGASTLLCWFHRENCRYPAIERVSFWILFGLLLFWVGGASVPTALLLVLFAWLASARILHYVLDLEVNKRNACIHRMVDQALSAPYKALEDIFLDPSRPKVPIHDPTYQWLDNIRLHEMTPEARSQWIRDAKMPQK